MATYRRLLGCGALLPVVVAVLAATSTTLAQNTYTWRMAGSGSWTDQTKWNRLSGYPGNNLQDKAYVTATGSAYQVTLDTDITIGEFRLGSSAVTLDLSSHVLTVTGESLMTSGTLNLAAGQFKQVGGTFRYNSGLTILGGAVQMIDAKLSMGSIKAASFITRGDCTLEGSTYAGQAITVLADGRAASLSGFSTNGATLNLDSTGAYDVTLGKRSESPPSFSNTGTINVQAGGGGSRTIAREFSNDLTGTVNFNAPTTTIAGFTNQGSFNIAPGATVQMAQPGDVFEQINGTLNVQGSLTIVGGGFVAAGGTITGGPITLIDSGVQADVSTSCKFVLHGNCAGGVGPNGSAEISVLAEGRPALLSCAVIRGVLNLDSTTPHEAGLSTQYQISNIAGATLNVLPGAGGQRTITGSFLNNAQATLNIGATTQFLGTGKYVGNYGDWNLTDAGAAMILNQHTLGNYGGTIRGIGTIDVSATTFTNKATIAPGMSIGILTILGDLHQTATGSLALELAGDAVAGVDYDQLKLTGTAYLGGTLKLSLLDGFTPNLGDAFKVLDFAAAQGEFQMFSLPALGAGLNWDTSTLSTDGTIRITPDPASMMLVVLAFALGAGVRRSRRST